jgi:hypothetical protein
MAFVEKLSRNFRREKLAGGGKSTEYFNGMCMDKKG